MQTVLRVFIWMLFVTGVAYPLLITVVGQLAFPTQAGGSLVQIDNVTVGSRLIAQEFKSDRYFWSRPSAVHYNPLPSGGSNLGPTSRVLQEAVKTRAKAYGGDVEKIPSDLLFASGSGLDPHISPAAAYFQVDRVVSARALNDKQAVIELIRQRGPCCVNVLELNIALDALTDATGKND